MNMQGFRISRCFKPESFGRVARVEPHHFADALQENGYGTVSHHIMGKSCVRPLKNTVTLP